jgi:hypothetical protein
VTGADIVDMTLSRSERIPPEAINLVEKAASDSLVLRITGSVAVRLHCEQHWQLLSSLGRRPYHDIDFWGLRKDQPKIERFFAEQGYVVDPKCKHLHEWGIKRLIFEHPGSAVKVDVFMDELVMAHTINFKDRLLLDYPCVPLSDLLLSKLQIHEITENDLMDLVVLLFEHPFGSGEGQIEIDHVARVLARDWCFWYEATLNIGKIRSSLDRYDALDDRVKAMLEARLTELEARIATEPKDRRWKMRAAVGARKRWYELVGDVDR